MHVGFRRANVGALAHEIGRQTQMGLSSTGTESNRVSFSG